MTRLALALAALAVLALLALGLAAHGREQDAAERAALVATLHARDAALAALETRTARVDTQYTRDTVTLTHWQTRYAALRDTIRQTDTLRIPALVDRALVAADSGARACAVTVTTCAQRVAQRDSLIAQLRAQRTDADRLAAFTVRAATPRLTASLAALWDLTARGPAIGAGADLRLLGHVSATAHLSQALVPGERPRVLVGLRVGFAP